MPYTTLNSLTTAIRTFWENHAQVNTFHFGYSYSDLNNPKNATSVSYPYVFAVKQPSRVYRQYVLVPITFSIMTQCPDVELDIEKTHSDMLEIARDMIANFTIVAGGNTESFYIDGAQSNSWNIEFFEDNFKDSVAGVSVTVEFKLAMPLSKCYIPTRE
jgi:hypothetical protein